MTRTTTIRNYHCACGKDAFVAKTNSLLSGRGSLNIPLCHTCNRVVCSDCSRLYICKDCLTSLSPGLRSKIKRVAASEKSNMWCILSLLVGEIFSLLYWIREEDGLNFVFLIMGLGIGFVIAIPVMSIKELIDKVRRRNAVNEAKRELSSRSLPKQSGVRMQKTYSGYSFSTQPPPTSTPTTPTTRTTPHLPPSNTHYPEDGSSLNQPENKKKKKSDPTDYNWLSQYKD